MRRYVTPPLGANMWDGADAETYLARTVFEADDKPRKTGLLDASGTMLYAVDEIEPIGFVRLK